MKSLLLLLALPLMICFKTDNPNCGGKERWDVKTLADNSADSISYFQPIDLEIRHLIKLQPGFVPKMHSPRQGYEFNTYFVVAKVKDYFKEEDGDVHIVLQDEDSTELTMIAEMPDGDCEAVKKSDRAWMIDSVQRKFLAIPKKQMIGQNVCFIGVGFFDIKHPTPQRGVAPNGMELHPILYFERLIDLGDTGKLYNQLLNVKP